MVFSDVVDLIVTQAISWLLNGALFQRFSRIRWNLLAPYDTTRASDRAETSSRPIFTHRYSRRNQLVRTPNSPTHS